MAKNYYRVEAVFQKSRFFYKHEFWEGPARNVSVATRKAIQEIMNRKNVKRLVHQQIDFSVEKIGKITRGLGPKETG